MGKHGQVCPECGDMIEKGAYGSDLCEDCYAKAWDSGFESTSEHAYEIGHSELNDSLAGELTNEFEGIIREIMNDFDTEAWTCLRCGKERVTAEDVDAKEFDDLVAGLLEPCPGCGVEGFLEHHVRGSHFS